LSTMAAHVGLDPAKDIKWVTSPKIPPMELFAQVCAALRRNGKNLT